MSYTDSLTSAEAGTSTPGNRSRTLMTAVAAVVALGAGLAIGLVAGGSSSSGSAAEVRKTDQTLREALVAGDADTVDRILAPDLELVDPAGDQETRAAYLGSVASGALEYLKFEPVTPVEVRISGDLAVVSFESRLAVSAGPDHLEHQAWHTHVYEKQHGQWRQVWSQATTVGGFPPAP